MVVFYKEATSPRRGLVLVAFVLLTPCAFDAFHLVLEFDCFANCVLATEVVDAPPVLAQVLLDVATIPAACPATPCVS